MSNDKKPETTKPEPQRTGPERIAVRVLTFREPHPSFGGVSSLTSDLTHTNRNHYVIEYLPRDAHHRVEYRPIDGKPRTVYVPREATVGWEPMA